jgi:glycosyltransferase involved in cell wall biosynthesis
MEAQGVDVTLLDPHSRPFNPLFGLHPLYMGLDPYRTAKVLLGNRRVDLVLSVFEASCTLPLLLRRAFRFKPKIAMWDIVPEEVWKPRSFLQDIVLPRIDHVFLLSSGQKSYLQRRWNAAAKTTVILQLVDAEFYQPGAPIVDGPILAIGDDVGRDFDTLMRAVHDLDIDLIVKTKRPLLELPGRRARVKQISARLSFKELRDLYASAKFVIVPVHQTLNVSGVGSVLEAMAMGKALVVSDNPRLRDYFIPGETAIVPPTDDPQALRDAIMHLNNNFEMRQALGRNGRSMVERFFANPVFGARMAQAIRDVVFGHDPSSMPAAPMPDRDK